MEYKDTFFDAKIFKINLAISKKWFTFAVPFGEEGIKFIENTGR
jgi:hypothetical protein